MNAREDPAGARAQVFYRECETTPIATAPEGEIYVEFTPNAALRILVPAKMREIRIPYVFAA